MYRASIYSVTPFVIVSTTVAGFGFGLKFSQANRSTALYPSLAPSHTLSLSHSRLCTWFPLPCLCTLPLSANPPCLGQMLNLFRRIFITRDTAKAKAMYKRVPADIKICTGVSHAADAAEAVAEAHAQMQGKMGDHVPSLFLIFMTSNHDHEARSSQLAAAPPLSFLPTHPPHAHPRHHPHPYRTPILICTPTRPSRALALTCIFTCAAPTPAFTLTRPTRALTCALAHGVTGRPRAAAKDRARRTILWCHHLHGRDPGAQVNAQQCNDGRNLGDLGP